MRSRVRRTNPAVFHLQQWGTPACGELGYPLPPPPLHHKLQTSMTSATAACAQTHVNWCCGRPHRSLLLQNNKWDVIDLRCCTVSERSRRENKTAWQEAVTIMCPVWWESVGEADLHRTYEQKESLIQAAVQNASFVMQAMCSELVKSEGWNRRADGTRRPSTVWLECRGYIDRREVNNGQATSSCWWGRSHCGMSRVQCDQGQQTGASPQSKNASARSRRIRSRKWYDKWGVGWRERETTRRKEIGNESNEGRECLTGRLGQPFFFM